MTGRIVWENDYGSVFAPTDVDPLTVPVARGLITFDTGDKKRRGYNLGYHASEGGLYTRTGAQLAHIVEKWGVLSVAKRELAALRKKEGRYKRQLTAVRRKIAAARLDKADPRRAQLDYRILTDVRRRLVTDAGYVTFGQLAAADDEAILAIKGIGPQLLDQIRSNLLESLGPLALC